MASVASVLVMIWALLHIIQKGYHINTLTGIQESMICLEAEPSHGSILGLASKLNSLGTFGGMDPCVQMTSTEYGVLVSIVTIGMLIGAIFVTHLTKLVGRYACLVFSSFLGMLASVVFASTNSLQVMVICRLVLGFLAAVAGVTVPLLMVELHPRLKDPVGITCEICLTISFIIAQIVCLPLNRPRAWRWVPLIGGVLGLVLFLWGLAIQFTRPRNKIEVRPDPENDAQETDALLAVQEEEIVHMTEIQALSTRSPVIRTGLILNFFNQVTLHLVGIPPLLFFSTRILGPFLPIDPGYVIIVVLLAKIPASFLTYLVVPRLGSERTLIYSFTAIGLLHSTLALSLNYSNGYVASAAIIGIWFIHGLGPGPVSWIIVAEVLPVEARTAAMSMSWITTSVVAFVLSAGFLPLQEYLRPASGGGEGNIYFFFAASSFACAAITRLTYVAWYRAKEHAEIGEVAR